MTISVVEEKIPVSLPVARTTSPFLLCVIVGLHFRVEKKEDSSSLRDLTHLLLIDGNAENPETPCFSEEGERTRKNLGHPCQKRRKGTLNHSRPYKNPDSNEKKKQQRLTTKERTYTASKAEEGRKEPR